MTTPPSSDIAWLILLGGAPGAGKSTLAAALAAPGALPADEVAVVSVDAVAAALGREYAPIAATAADADEHAVATLAQWHASRAACLVATRDWVRAGPLPPAHAAAGTPDVDVVPPTPPPASSSWTTTCTCAPCGASTTESPAPRWWAPVARSAGGGDAHVGL